MEEALQRIRANEISLIDHDRRLKNLEILHAQLIELNRQNAEMLITMNTLKDTIGTIDAGVKSLESKFRDHELEPAGNWKKLGWAILMLIAGAIMALVFAKIGLNP